MRSVYLYNSHRWLHARLTERAVEPERFAWADSPADADLIIVPVPPWPDAVAPLRAKLSQLRALNRIFLFSQADVPIVWAPGVYTSVSARDQHAAMCRGGFYIAPNHYEAPHAEGLSVRPFQAPDVLWSFAGSVYTCAALRGRVTRLTDPRAITRDTNDWSRLRWHSEGELRAERHRLMDDYAELLHRTKFVVCPRGRGPSTIRVFDAMRVGRVPVIVSDDWLPPPRVDWENCSIRVREDDVESIPKLLREREREAEMMGQLARREWERSFAPETMLATIVTSCLDLEHHVSRAQRAGAVFGSLRARETQRLGKELVKSGARRSARYSTRLLRRRGRSE